ncbi:uncharacterized protein B0H18DRAFT_303671 [Fomitopsis serialis]|uniref:uncharacterized protein n=1 Tax=Fomitopsis serialis TaxID=139415 RepID=UPI00200780D3|nr:uncharacterized protein B0H18DRAFT_303671 [Neoantrodia serialis]KAH9926928.1 hypothetical protein B0H18DRAFT_303671 [Neoantrodia serialis]
MEEIITKRLHISGLTPAITPDDLAKRLGSFGAVKAMDGFGLTDAVGQPRKFGYVTLEATKKNLGRCESSAPVCSLPPHVVARLNSCVGMNLLSGVTWKGTKLRIGEAKPDFRERIAQEHDAMKRTASDPDDDRPTKRRRLPRGVQGVHAADMSLVTPENVASRPGWRVTALGRIIRPIRMRPEHPLPDPHEAAIPQAKGRVAQKVVGKKKKRVKDPPTRAWRRTIDPTRWGSEHLKGMFLENVVVASVPRNVPAVMAREDAYEESSGTTSDGDEAESDSASSTERYAGKERQLASPVNTGTSRHVSSTLRAPDPAVFSRTGVQNIAQSDLKEETQKSLGLLQTLFGAKGDDDWGEKESVGSAVDQDDQASPEAATMPADLVEHEEDENDAGDVNEEGDATDAGASTDKSLPDAASTAIAPIQATKLKDLFASREEDVGFSLLGHLDLDLELDEEVDLHLPTRSQARSEPAALPLPTAIPSLPSFDPKAPLFFPLPPEERNRGRVYDVLDPTNWRTWFYRTDSEEDIQKRWEAAKGELTSGWKRRHREAVKSRRRRGGGPGDTEA